MKTFIIGFATVILYISTLNSVLGQTAATALDQALKLNNKIVEYKWGEGQFVDVMPFDDQFVIKITGMDKEIQFINMTLYEIHRNYTLFKGGKNSINDIEFKKMPSIKKYSLAWSRNPGDTNNFAFLPEEYHLRPNSKYIVEIMASTKGQITEDEKLKIRNELSGSDEIRSLLTTTLDFYKKNPRTTFTVLKNKITPQLNDIVKTKLAELNKNYFFEIPLNEDVQVDKITDLVKSFNNFYRKMVDLPETIDEQNNGNHQQTVLAVMKKTLSETSFGDFAFDTTKQKNFDSLIKLFDTSKINKLTLKDKILAALQSKNSFISSAKQIVDTIIDHTILENIYILNSLGANYPLNMTDQANNYLGLDFGAAYVGNFSRFQTYYGLNIYFRPINKNIPLSRYVSLKDWLLTRTSLLLGVTFSSIEKDNVRKGILGDKGIILGTGFRIVSFFRINAGGLLYYRYPSTPLQNRDNFSAKISPFFSASFDLDVESLLGAVGKSIFPASK